MEQLTEQQKEQIAAIDAQLKTDIDKLNKKSMSDMQKAIKLALDAKAAKQLIINPGN